MTTPVDNSGGIVQPARYEDISRFVEKANSDLATLKDVLSDFEAPKTTNRYNITVLHSATEGSSVTNHSIRGVQHIQSRLGDLERRFKNESRNCDPTLVKASDSVFSTIQSMKPECESMLRELEKRAGQQNVADRVNKVATKIFNQITSEAESNKFLINQSDVAIRSQSRLMNKVEIFVAPKKENQMAWTETYIPGDSNCGFTATNTSRKEVVTYLLRNSNSEPIRSMVAPEIKGWLLMKEYQKNKLPEVLEQRLDQSAEEDTLDDASMDRAVFEAYVRHYYGEGEKGGYLVIPDYDRDSCATGVMNVIVEMKGTPIRIWKENPNEPGEVYLHAIVGDVTDENMGKTLDVIHKGGVKHEAVNHFNKLNGRPRVVALGSTEQYNPI